MWLFCQCHAKMARNLYEIRTKFVRNSYEIRPQSASKIGTVNVVVTNFVPNSYEFRMNFARSSNNLHEVVSFLCVCGCAWSEGLLFVWAWVHGVCVPGSYVHALVVLGFLGGFVESDGTILLCCV